MTRSNAARDKAARLAVMRHAPGVDSEHPAKAVEQERPAARPSSGSSAPVPRQSLRVRPVRITLDLAPELHGEFTAWCSKSAREVGRVKVNGSDVLRVLIRQLLVEDGQLSGQVMEALRREGQ